MGASSPRGSEPPACSGAALAAVLALLVLPAAWGETRAGRGAGGPCGQEGARCALGGPRSAAFSGLRARGQGRGGSGFSRPRSPSAGASAHPRAEGARVQTRGARTASPLHINQDGLWRSAALIPAGKTYNGEGEWETANPGSNPRCEESYCPPSASASHL